MARESLTDPLAMLPPLRPSGKMTYEEFLAWDSGDEHYEWVEGEAVWMGTVSGEHNEAGMFLLALIREFVAIFVLGIVRYEPFNMKTGPGLPGRCPDILFVANENLTRVKKNHLDGPADLVVEIISPESRERDQQKKYAEYEQGGVREYWLIDPINQEAAFYQRGPDGKYRAVSVDESGAYHSLILPGFWLNVDWLWQSPLPTLRYALKEWNLE